MTLVEINSHFTLVTTVDISLTLQTPACSSIQTLVMTLTISSSIMKCHQLDIYESYITSFITGSTQSIF